MERKVYLQWWRTTPGFDLISIPISDLKTKTVIRIISFLFVKDGQVYPMLKEIRKEALKHLSLAFIEFEQLLSWLPLRDFWVISLS